MFAPDALALIHEATPPSRAAGIATQVDAWLAGLDTGLHELQQDRDYADARITAQ